MGNSSQLVCYFSSISYIVHDITSFASHQGKLEMLDTPAVYLKKNVAHPLGPTMKCQLNSSFQHQYFLQGI